MLWTDAVVCCHVNTLNQDIRMAYQWLTCITKYKHTEIWLIVNIDNPRPILWISETQVYLENVCI